MSDFLPSNDKCIIQYKKVATRGKKTAKQAHPMRKVRVSLYFGRSFDKHDTAPVMICVNHASSSCYIPIPGVRIKRNQWDKVRKKVINHPQSDIINSVALSIFGRYVNKFNGRKEKKTKRNQERKASDKSLASR